MAKIFIDINAPSFQRIKIAIPDFKDLSKGQCGQDLGKAMPSVLSNDLDMSGYFEPMDRAAFLQGDASAGIEETRFKEWSVIGAELLLRGGLQCTGQSLEVEVRLYDVYRGVELLAKRYLGRTSEQRAIMHRVANDIIFLLTGQKGMFLSRIAYVGTASGHKEVWTSDYDGYNAQQMTSDKSITMMPRWSPTGDRLLFTSYKEGGVMVYLKEMASGAVRRVSTRTGSNSVFGGAWAPDGKTIALTLSPGGNPDVYTMDLNGRIIDRLTSFWDIDTSPTFSPDGTKIAFVSNRSGAPQIYVRDLAQGKEDRITFEGTYNTSPAWSNLNRIAYVAMIEGRFDIVTIDPDGGNPRRLTAGQGNNENPCWSADGRYILFNSDREGGSHLYLMNAWGQNQRRIPIPQGGNQTFPSWAPF